EDALLPGRVDERLSIGREDGPRLLTRVEREARLQTPRDVEDPDVGAAAAVLDRGRDALAVRREDRLEIGLDASERAQRLAVAADPVEPGTGRVLLRLVEERAVRGDGVDPERGGRGGHEHVL